MIHLTFTGVSAGTLLCGQPREGKEVNHAVYAPLEKEEFRKNCCPKCLSIYAFHAYDEGDEMPDYIKEIRNE